MMFLYRYLPPNEASPRFSASESSFFHVLEPCCSHINSSPKLQYVVTGQAPITLEWKNASEKKQQKTVPVHIVAEAHPTPKTRK